MTQDNQPGPLSLSGYEFYVRLDPERRAETVTYIRTAVATNGRVYDQASHAAVLWRNHTPPEELLQRLSGELHTQVIWLAFQNTVDAFEYQHWESGTCVRRLAYGCRVQERTWERVEGEPEPWEANAFFGRRARKERLLRTPHGIVRILSQPAAPPSGDCALRARSEEPAIIARDAAEAVATEYGLPGWT